MIFKWFDVLAKKNINVAAYVIMPNHVHSLLHFPEMPKSLNNIVGNAKRFMSCSIIERLEANKEHAMLDVLHDAVSKRERKKGQIHRVFEESFEAKECYTKDFIYQKLNYIHHNPVSGKWKLVADFTEYEYSSASFYEKGIKKYAGIVHINEVLY